MHTPLQELIELVAASGMDRDHAVIIADYIADRCAALSLTSVHSSGHSSLSRDEFLTTTMGLSAGQIKAWLALLRGTRLVRRRNGLMVGGCPGFVQAVACGGPDARQMRRYRALARRAAPPDPDLAEAREDTAGDVSGDRCAS